MFRRSSLVRNSFSGERICSNEEAFEAPDTGLMIGRLFQLPENNTNAGTEVLAGVTTFLTMAYIIFVQPAGTFRENVWYGHGHGLRRSNNGNVSFSRAGNSDHGAVRTLPYRSGSGSG